MSQAAIIINVSDQVHMHHNGISGQFSVPGRKEGEQFGILVVFPTPETQDIGDNKKTTHWLKALPIAKDVIGLRSDSAAHGFGDTGTKEKWGLYLCEAEPDLPKVLLKAVEDEMEYLSKKRPRYAYEKDEESGAMCVIDISAESVQTKKRELSAQVEKLRNEFIEEFKGLVQKKEVLKAKQRMQQEDQRLVSEGDRMWATEKEKNNVNELHRNACTRLGQERPWCYIPLQLVDCPGCGAKIKEDIITCPACGGLLEFELDVLRAMSRRDRSQSMYPNRYLEPTGTGGAKK